MAPRNSIPGGFAYIWQSKRVGIIATKTERKQIHFLSDVLVAFSSLIGSLSNNDGDGYENVTYKVKSRCFKLHRAYSISFDSSNAGNFFWSWILKECDEVQEKRNKVVVLCSRPPQDVKLGISRPSGAVTGKKCTKKRVARAELLSCQSKPAPVLPFSLTSPSSLRELNNNDGDNAAADDDDDDGSSGGGGGCDDKRIELFILTVARYRYFRRVCSSLHWRQL